MIAYVHVLTYLISIIQYSCYLKKLKQKQQKENFYYFILLWFNLTFSLHFLTNFIYFLCFPLFQRDQFRYIIKIQPKTTDLSMRLWGITTEFVGSFVSG